MCLLTREEARVGEREIERSVRKTLISCLSYMSPLGSNVQPSYVACPGIKPTAFLVYGWHSNHLSHQAKAHIFFHQSLRLPPFWQSSACSPYLWDCFCCVLLSLLISFIFQIPHTSECQLLCSPQAYGPATSSCCLQWARQSSSTPFLILKYVQLYSAQQVSPYCNVMMKPSIHIALMCQT